jgi:hypothetical protein
MAIFDAMQLCRSDVSTICFGLAASTAAIVLAGGTKGRRFAMPNSRIMMHQPLGGASGQAIDVEIQAKEVMYHRSNVTRILSEITGRSTAQVCFVVVFVIELSGANTSCCSFKHGSDAEFFGFRFCRSRRTLTGTGICLPLRLWSMVLLMA